MRFALALLALSIPLAAREPDVIVVGAGISGLSAALEAARRGARVVVVEMSTVGGGHAILSNGAVAIVGTPLQAKNSVQDSPEIAAKDLMTRGEDADPAWVARYVRDSKSWLYDWLSELGVRFDALVKPPGNSVPRLHLARNKGWGLVGPMIREAMRHPNIRFVWASQVEGLVLRGSAVSGVMVRHLRSGKRKELHGRNVVVATGGFQSNLELVRQNWPSHLPKPARLLLGGAHSATGSGHDLIVRAGGTLSRMDHQWNYVLGLPDPRDPQGVRGLAAFNFSSIWINALGRRFTPEFGDPKLSLSALLQQPGAAYWSIFDEDGKRGFRVTLAGWENYGEVSQLAYGPKGSAIAASTLEELAAKIGVPGASLNATVERYNQLTETGVDADFQAFGPKTTPKPKKIVKPPFYALQFFPITRKSMGGVKVDDRCRVLSSSGQPIPNLFAVGEVTGFAGINGRSALEGTFLGPAIYMGRIAGRTVIPRESTRPTQLRRLPDPAPPHSFEDKECLACHDVATEVKLNRPGYWHYEQSHAKVLARNYSCSRCHGDLHPYRKRAHSLDRLMALNHCVTCHGTQSAAAIPGEP